MMGIEYEGDYLLVSDTASGTETISAGDTNVDVTHGLDFSIDSSEIPKIQLTPLDNLGGRSFWAEVHPTTPETHFRIYISTADPLTDHDIGWRYV